MAIELSDCSFSRLWAIHHHYGNSRAPARDRTSMSKHWNPPDSWTDPVKSEEGQQLTSRRSLRGRCWLLMAGNSQTTAWRHSETCFRLFSQIPVKTMMWLGFYMQNFSPNNVSLQTENMLLARSDSEANRIQHCWGGKPCMSQWRQSPSCFLKQQRLQH